MKITGQKIFVANAQRTNFVFLKVYTDAGVDGVGEATLEWKTESVVGALREVPLRALQRAALRRQHQPCRRESLSDPVELARIRRQGWAHIAAIDALDRGDRMIDPAKAPAWDAPP